jgi:hypothetical protein
MVHFARCKTSGLACAFPLRLASCWIRSWRHVDDFFWHTYHNQASWQLSGFAH